MTKITRESVDEMLKLFENKDMEKILSLFSENAVLYDPHYPEIEMVGKAAIRRGFEFAFAGIKKTNFNIIRFWSDEQGIATEVDTYHLFNNGREIKLQQVFLVEFQNGLISRMRSFVPYPPHGIGGFLPKVIRIIWKLTGKIKKG